MDADPKIADEANSISNDGLSPRLLRRSECPFHCAAIRALMGPPVSQSVFGMNVQEIVPNTNGTLAHYAETALPFTLVTIWVIIASQNRYIFPAGLNFWARLAWPVLVLGKVFTAYPLRWTWPTSAKKGAKEGEGRCSAVAVAMTNVAKGG